MSKNTSPSLRHLIVAATLALIVSAGLVYFGGGDRSSDRAGQSGGVAGISIGGAYELTDHEGRPRKSSEFEGVYKLIYFGFTYCPVICPTELSKITGVLKMLPDNVAAKVQPIFITIDPERDTPEVLKDYLSLFDVRFVGLTGSADQIKAVTDSYRIYAAKVQDEALNDYTMDHSSYIYLMSPEDELINIYRTDDSPADIAGDIEKLF